MDAEDDSSQEDFSDETNNGYYRSYQLTKEWRHDLLRCFTNEKNVQTQQKKTEISNR